MKKEITLGQLLAVGFSLLVTIISAWVALTNKVSSQDIRIKTLEENQIKWDRVVERIEAKIDEGNKMTTQILIKLEGKKDR